MAVHAMIDTFGQIISTRISTKTKFVTGAEGDQPQRFVETMHNPF